LVGIACIGAEKEFRRPAGRGAAQRLAVLFALGDRQAIEVRADAALEDRIAIDRQVVRRDRRGEIGAARGNVIDRLRRRDVLKNDPQFGKASNQGHQDALDEHGLAVEQIDVRVGDLAVDQEGHAERGHALEHRRHAIEIGDAVRRVGRRVRRVELDRGEDALFISAADLARIGAVGQIACHQRREIRARRQCRDDPAAIGEGSGDRRDWRHEVGHHDSPRERRRRMRQHRRHHRPVAQMQMPVVRPADRQRIGHLPHRISRNGSCPFRYKTLGSDFSKD
jgi:hypothetical protein